MILGAGWAFLGLVVVGLAMLVLVPACGVVVVNEAPGSAVDLKAPALVEADPAVEARTAAVATMSLARARRQTRSVGAAHSQRRVRPGPGGRRGSRSTSSLLLADREVVPGASALRISSRKSAAQSGRRVARLPPRGSRRRPRRGPAPADGSCGDAHRLGSFRGSRRLSALAHAAPLPGRGRGLGRRQALRRPRTCAAADLRPPAATRPAGRSSTPRAVSSQWRSRPIPEPALRSPRRSPRSARR